MNMMIIRAAVLAAAVAGVMVGAGQAVADPGAALVNARCDDRMVSQPAEIILNCTDQPTTLTGLQWAYWDDATATAAGYGYQNGPFGSGPVAVVLEQPVKQATGQIAFTRAIVRTVTLGKEQFAIEPARG